jgi:flagellar basal-body rod protein FlgC
MNLISSNLANINTTRTTEGGPYKRKDAVFSAEADGKAFHNTLKKQLNTELVAVKVSEIVTDNGAPIQRFDPGHPDADENGYVSLPNVNVVEEMVNMISATRSYEANVTAIKATKEMINQALEIGR